MMRVILLGTGAPRPDAERAPPSQLIVVDNLHMVFDCGSGSLQAMAKVGINIAEISHIFLTHWHYDHVSDFPSIILAAYLAGRKDPINVYGPQGSKEKVKLLLYDAFPYIFSLVKNLKGSDIQLNVVELKAGEVTHLEERSISTSKVVHGNIEALAYRVDTEYGSVCISGDTAPCAEIIALSNGADILIHDCAYPDLKGESPIHTIPRQLGDIANKAKVKKVILTHLFPETKGKEIEMVTSISKSFSGEIIVGTDLMQIYLCRKQ